MVKIIPLLYNERYIRDILWIGKHDLILPKALNAEKKSVRIDIHCNLWNISIIRFSKDKKNAL